MGQEICLILGQVSLKILCRKRNLQTDICVRGETDKTASDIQARSFKARTLDEIVKKVKLKEKQKWSNENQSSIMPEDYEESISLTLRTKSSKKPLGMLEENWKHQWLPPCFARHAGKARMGRPVARLTISNQNLRVSWKPVNPHDCVWKNLYRIIMRTISQEKETIHYNISIRYTNLFLCLKSHENTRGKSSSGQGMGKIGKDSGVEPDKSQK